MILPIERAHLVLIKWKENHPTFIWIYIGEISEHEVWKENSKIFLDKKKKIYVYMYIYIHTHTAAVIWGPVILCFETIISTYDSIPDWIVNFRQVKFQNIRVQYIFSKEVT